MTFLELLEKYPELSEQAQERLDIMVIEGMDEQKAMKEIVTMYKLRYGLFEQRKLFDQINDPKSKTANALLETHKLQIGKEPVNNWWSD